MRSLADPAGKRIGNERPVEEWIEDPVDGMMEQTVAHARFVNVPAFRVVDDETLVAAVPIRPVYQILVKCDNVVHQTGCECPYVALLSFSYDKLFPGQT